MCGGWGLFGGVAEFSGTSVRYTRSMRVLSSFGMDGWVIGAFSPGHCSSSVVSASWTTSRE